MPPVKEGRVTKRTSSSAAGTRMRRAGRDRNAKSATPKELPLVERTNSLPLPELISRYIPASLLTINTTTTITITNGGDPPTSETVQETRHIDIYTAATIPDAEFEACFKLIEMSSSNDYSGSGMGWSPVKKRKEMRLPDMRYLVLRGDEEWDSGTEEDVNVLGFLSFMVTYEDGKEVIYCYEIHLAPSAQGTGLGRVLMMRYEEIGKRVGLEKAMLTVFKSNARALRFYEKMGYAVDEFSPSPRTLRNGTVKEPEYLILSKGLKGPTGKGDGIDDQ